MKRRKKRGERLCSLKIRFLIRREERKPVFSLHCICLLLPVSNMSNWSFCKFKHVNWLSCRSLCVHMLTCLYLYIHMRVCMYSQDNDWFFHGIHMPWSNVLIVFFLIFFFCNRNAEKDQSPWAFFNCIHYCMHASKRTSTSK